LAPFHLEQKMPSARTLTAWVRVFELLGELEFNVVGD
jgi:hypothetical protein